MIYFYNIIARVLQFGDDESKSTLWCDKKRICKKYIYTYEREKGKKNGEREKRQKRDLNIYISSDCLDMYI